jgi:hypothetical protein
VKNTSFGPIGAVFWATLLAGTLDIGAVFAFWAPRGVPPSTVTQSIASSITGAAAYQGGMGSIALGIFLHVFVTVVFATAYVLVAMRAKFLTTRPLLWGPLYGLLAYVIMVFGVVPMSNAQFGGSWPPPPLDLAVSLAIHLLLFGLPIAWVASHLRR